MKLLLVGFLFVLTNTSTGQNTYNYSVSDEIVIKFMHDALDPQRPWKTIVNNIKKVYRKPIHLSEAPWMLGGIQHDMDFEGILSHLKEKLSQADSIFSQDDIAYISQQYREYPEGAEWPDFEGRRMKRKKGKRVFEFSVPLFSVDKKTAVCWSYYYIGSLNASSILQIYQLIDGKWVSNGPPLAGWMS